MNRLCLLGAVAGVVVTASPAQAMMGHSPIDAMLMFNELEYGFNQETNPVGWDMTFWVGGDYDRFRLQTEGHVTTDTPEAEAELRLLYSRLVTPFWELHIGLRGDLAIEHGAEQMRAHLAIGLDGVAAYWFELEPTIFVSQKGDVSARLGVTHELFVTQRLVVQSSLEVNFAVQAVPEFGVGRGLNDLELGLRFRYEIIREVAPYIGVTWRQHFGEAADMLEAKGQSSTDVRGVAGVRFWF